jgi:hypothetical protein
LDQFSNILISTQDQLEQLDFTDNAAYPALSQFFGHTLLTPPLFAVNLADHYVNNMASKTSAPKSQRSGSSGSKSAPIRKLAAAATAAVKLAAKQQDLRAARTNRSSARRPQSQRQNTIVATKRYSQPARSAPVAFDGKSLKPFMRVQTNVAGDSYRAHVLDRLDPIIINTPAQNVTGALLVQIPINTSVLGERLRRISSTYEYYKFITSRFHFVSSLGTIYGGSLLGFIDSDPVDQFNQGVTSLKEAAAHPSAAAHKIWNDFTWTAPPAPPGRVYVDVVSSDPASVRQQQQGSFVVMLDSAITLPGNDISYPLTLGNLYVEYVVDLSYPTIQSGFVGSFSQSSYVPAAPYSVSTDVYGQVFPFGAVLPDVVLANVGNRAIETQAVSTTGINSTGIILRPGVYNLTWGMEAKTSNAASCLLTHKIYSNRIAGLLLSPEAVDYAPTAPLNPIANGNSDTALTTRAGLHYTDGGVSGNTSRNASTRIVVPANDTQVWFPVLQVSTSQDLIVYSGFIEIVSTSPTLLEATSLAPSTASDDINSRLAAIEAKFSAADNTTVPLPIDSAVAPVSFQGRASHYDHEFAIITNESKSPLISREPPTPQRRK